MESFLNKLNRWFEYTIIPWYTSLGLTKRTVTLEVIGRKSGLPRKVTVTSVKDNRFRYLVSVRGESHWVRNVRAANGRATLLSGSREPVKLIEIPVHERAPILLNYVQKGAFGHSSAQIAQVFGLESDPTLDQMSDLASQHPVFRIDFSH